MEPWLKRTGNGQVHETTKRVPRVMFAEEQKHLAQVPELGSRMLLPRLAAVRKTSVGAYRQNRSQMPLGTDQLGQKGRH